MTTTPCGIATEQSITIHHDPHHGNRTFWLYIPAELCGGDTTTVTVAPLVMALHCLGCTAHTMLDASWTIMADRYSFVLAVPVGLRNSFNAVTCCGYAMQEGVDDIGFLQEIIDTLTKTRTHYTPPGVIVSRQAVYAVGWSNGGYLATYAARLFRAIAPISGYQVTPWQDTSQDGDDQEQQSIGLFQHHAVDDRFVRITGCCSNVSTPSCCCGLDEGAEQCTTAFDHFRWWSTSINHCSNNNDDSSDIRISYQTNAVTCWTMTAGCRANTTLCQHSTGGHFNRPSFAQAFDMTEAIADFFARDACQIETNKNNMNQWHSITRHCDCATIGDGHANSSGPYCLVSGDENDGSSNSLYGVDSKARRSDDQLLIPTGWLAIVMFVGLLGGFYYCYKDPHRRRIRGFAAVSTVELPSIVIGDRSKVLNRE